MRRRRKVLLLVAVAAAAVGMAWVLRGRIALRVFEWMAVRNLRSDLLEQLPDGLHVALCGAGSPIPDPLRSGPCTAVIAGRRLFVVDAGSGSARVLARMHLSPGHIEGIFLSHFHSDHIDGLGELLLQRWVNSGATAPLAVWGPTGVSEVVEGFNRAYGLDRTYRVAHHGPEIVPPGGFGAVAREFVPPADGEGRTLVDEHGIRVVAFRVDHAPVVPAVGYRFEYGGRAVVISGDTRRSANVARFARGADVLVHEALAPDLVAVLTRAAQRAGRPRLARITRDILTYHTTPAQAAQIAREAGVRLLLLTHIVPPLPIRALEGPFLAGVGSIWDGRITVGRDGTLVAVEVPSGRIRVRELL